MGLHGQKLILKIRFGLGPDLTMIGSLNLNAMLKIEFRQIKIGLCTYKGH
jgi:hypothetical protein